MKKPKATPSAIGSQNDLELILTRAKEQFPGISELLEVYGGFEEMMLEVQQYLDVTQPKPFVTTSNQTLPEEVEI